MQQRYSVGPDEVLTTDPAEHRLIEDHPRLGGSVLERAEQRRLPRARRAVDDERTPTLRAVEPRWAGEDVHPLGGEHVHGAEHDSPLLVRSHSHHVDATSVDGE